MTDIQKDFEKEALRFGFKSSQFVKNCIGEYEDMKVRTAFRFFLTGVRYMCKDINKYL